MEGGENMDLMAQLNQLLKQLNASVKELRTTGTAYAQAEHDYKISVTKKALELRANGSPVSLINTTIYGYADIAKLRFERDVAETVYKANLEAINSVKLQLRLIEGQLSREFADAERLHS